MRWLTREGRYSVERELAIVRDAVAAAVEVRSRWGDEGDYAAGWSRKKSRRSRSRKVGTD